MRLTLYIAVALIGLIGSPTASAHWKPGAHNAVHAILDAFPAQHERDALNVAYCEAGAGNWQANRPMDARNGQYKFMFQMGEWERATYGNGHDPWRHAKAAFRYFAASGYDWSPWECKPWWKPMPRFLLAHTRYY